jgi:DNA invertase Pin-like site-specific DNA recombinase
MSRRKVQRDQRLAIAYLRVSTDRQDLGVDAQRAAIGAWAAASGVSVQAWHEERVSGGADLADRPELAAALLALRNGNAGILVVAKRDRLARDRTNAGLLEREVQRMGATVRAADGVGGDANDPMATAMAGMVDVFAEFERGMIRQRTRAALRVKRQRREKYNGTAPYGWSVDGRDLVANELEQAAIRTARELRAGGASYRAVALALDQAGHLPRGGKWHPWTVARMLAAATLESCP